MFRSVLFLGHHQVSPFFVCGGFSAFCNATKPPHTEKGETFTFHYQLMHLLINPLNPELNPICYLLALLAHHVLHVTRIRVKSLTIRLLMSYIYIYIYMERLFLMFLDHTQRPTTVGRTPLDE